MFLLSPALQKTYATDALIRNYLLVQGGKKKRRKKPRGPLDYILQSLIKRPLA